MPGLRREEVATLAGVSVDYYNRMERGNLARASQDQSTGRRRGPTRQTVRPSLEWTLEAITGGAAFLVNGRQDILAANRLGRAFFAPLFDSPSPPNMARFTYLDPRARDFHADWNRAAKECVAALRTQVGRDPFDRGLSDLVGELSTRCEEFAALWATHDVRLHHQAEKRFVHPLVGELTLQYHRLAVAADPGLEIFTYVAEPGSRSAEAFGLLASWEAETPPGARERA